MDPDPVFQCVFDVAGDGGGGERRQGFSQGIQKLTCTCRLSLRVEGPSSLKLQEHKDAQERQQGTLPYPTRAQTQPGLEPGQDSNLARTRT